MIRIEDFFELLLQEIAENPQLKKTYRFLDDSRPSVFNFRKRYFCQRLEYIQKSITKKDTFIWDCGCGFGTTAIFLTLNGYTVYGNTLEFFYEQLPARVKYWSRFGDLSKLTISYENHFDIKPKGNYDYIIAQDTLHHLEPIGQALKIIFDSLAKGGKLIAIEENGKSFINKFKNYIKRGNKLVIEFHDQRLDRTILLGNENLRSIDRWNQLLSENEFRIDFNSLEYIRLYTPFFYKILSPATIDKQEHSWWRRFSFLRNYFYFGINFIGLKN